MRVFTSLNSAKGYGIELRERNYPVFEGRYNAYVEVYGELSGQFLGLIDEPLKMDVSKDDLPELLNLVPEFITRSYKVANW